MRIIPAVLAISLLGATPARADFVGDFFRYEPTPVPPVGDCGALSAQYGAGSVWYGEYSGKRQKMWGNGFHPYGARGCFTSEAECRVWQQRSITHAVGPIYFTRCVPGARS
jgi:hypothetical protein